MTNTTPKEREEFEAAVSSAFLPVCFDFGLKYDLYANPITEWMYRTWQLARSQPAATTEERTRLLSEVTAARDYYRAQDWKNVTISFAVADDLIRLMQSAPATAVPDDAEIETLLDDIIWRSFQYGQSTQAWPVVRRDMRAEPEYKALRTLLSRLHPPSAPVSAMQGEAESP